MVVRYCLLLPVVVLAVGCVLVAVLRNAQVPPLLVGLACPLFCVPLLAGLIWLAHHDYARRMGTVLTIAGDGLFGTRGGQGFRLCFDEVRAVRMLPHKRDAQCVLELSSGGRFALPVDIAPFSKVQQALQATLVARLAEQLGETIALGGRVCLKEGRWQAWRLVARALLSLAMGILVLVTVRGIPLGVRLWRGAWTQLRRGWRGKSVDYEVTHEGLMPVWSVSRSDLHGWKWLRQIHIDDAGLLLRFEDGRTITASIFAENYWPFAVWLKQFLHEE
jgi:hypothetical protein